MYYSKQLDKERNFSKSLWMKVKDIFDRKINIKCCSIFSDFLRVISLNLKGSTRYSVSTYSFLSDDEKVWCRKH